MFAILMYSMLLIWTFKCAWEKIFSIHRSHLARLFCLTDVLNCSVLNSSNSLLHIWTMMANFNKFCKWYISLILEFFRHHFTSHQLSSFHLLPLNFLIKFFFRNWMFYFRPPFSASSKIRTYYSIIKPSTACIFFYFLFLLTSFV